MAETAASKRRGSRPTEVSDAQTVWLAGVVAIFTAALTVLLCNRISAEAKWAPFVGWFLAGAVAGNIVRHRAAAIKVAVISTVAAGAATGLLAFLTRPRPSWQKVPAQVTVPTLGEALMMTLMCSLAAVLGAAAVVEFYRSGDKRP